MVYRLYLLYMHEIDLLKVLIPSITAFVLGMLITPIFTKFFYKHKLWKKSSRSNIKENPDLKNKAFHEVHNEEAELRTPRTGGIIVWTSVLIVAIVFYYISTFSGSEIVQELNFVTRNQTWLPLFALLLGALMGWADDILQIFGRGNVDGIPRWIRIFLVFLIGLLGGLWFFYKLGIVEIAIPFLGSVYLGPLFVVFFILVVLGTYSSGVIDGVDGLSAGVLISAFMSYGVIAGIQGQFDVSALSFVLSGATTAFLWFNIPPARFYMGETGMAGLTIALAMIALVTNQALLLLVIGFPLVITSLSSLIQMIGLRVFKKRIFKLAPLHNYFLSIGWSREKVAMRYWVVSFACGLFGIIIVLLG